MRSYSRWKSSCQGKRKYICCQEKRGEMCEFIDEQLKKEYIRLSKLSQIVPVFFVGKKNSKKRMVLDYRYLNKWTVKNNYPLLLISDIMKNIGMKKIFTKLDL